MRVSFRACRAFSLVEVVIALGVFAVAIAAVLALIRPITRSTADAADANRAAALADAINLELLRIRDKAGRGSAGLDRLYDLTKDGPAELFGSSDGTRVVLKGDVKDAAFSSDPLAIPTRERFFLIELRQQPTFTYKSGTDADRSAFIALTATIKWPYTLSDGTRADLREASVLQLNYAVPP